MIRLRRRSARPDRDDVRLAADLDERKAAAREAEAALTAAEAVGTPPGEVAALRRALDARLLAAIEAAEAAYRVELGPLEGMSRVKYLARLTRPAVRVADDERRRLALARSHYRVDARDDLGSAALNSVPPSVGTRASSLGTHAGH